MQTKILSLQCVRADPIDQVFSVIGSADRDSRSWFVEILKTSEDDPKIAEIRSYRLHNAILNSSISEEIN